MYSGTITYPLRRLGMLAAMVLLLPLSSVASAGSAGAVPVVAVLTDPGSTGPLTPASVTYDLGDSAFTTPSIPGVNELRGIIHYPGESGDGPFPLIVLMHGRHESCAKTSGWPCAPGDKEVPSYRGYDYLGEHLASRGFVVMSIGTNGINFNDSIAEGGMIARAALLRKSLEMLKGWAGGAPGSPLPAGVGSSIDFTNVGLMGHSRGGEGVVTYAKEAEANSTDIDPKVVIPLVAVDFNRPSLDAVESATITSYCDGDVTDLQSVHFFDDNRNTATADRFWVAIDGTNHNFYNTVWSPESKQPWSGDDTYGYQIPKGDAPCVPTSPTRFSESEQREVGLRWMTTVFEASLHGSIVHRQMLEGTQPVPGVDATRSHVNWHPGSDRRQLINSFDTSARLIAGEPGGAVTVGSGLSATSCGSLTAAIRACRDVMTGAKLTDIMEPHASQSLSGVAPPEAPYVALGLGRLRWGTPSPAPTTTTTTTTSTSTTTTSTTTTATTVPSAGRVAASVGSSTSADLAAAGTTTALGDRTLLQELAPSQRSVGEADSIRLRIATVIDRYNKSDQQSGTVTITDGAAHTVTLGIADLDPTLLRMPPLGYLTEDFGLDESFRHMLVQQLRVPVATLNAQGLDTTDLRSIALTFDQASGDIVTSDWLYATETETPQPPATTTTTTTTTTTSAPIVTTAPAPTVTPVPVRFTG